jgi:large conductance mechanosensitive channel
MIKEFRDFIMRGNVIDLAVGIIMGAAFTAVVGSLVKDVILPPIGFLLGGVDFSDIAIQLKAAEGENPAVVIGIGVFLNALITFLITAFAVFLIVKAVNQASRLAKKKEEAAVPAGPTTDEQILTTLKALNETLNKLNK